MEGIGRGAGGVGGEAGTAPSAPARAATPTRKVRCSGAESRKPAAVPEAEVVWPQIPLRMCS